MRRLPVFVAVLAALLALLAAAAPPARAELASLVADLAVDEPGPNRGSDPGPFVRVGSRVIFYADPTGGGDRFPWATNGTAADTVRLPVADPLAAGLGTAGGAYLWFGRTLSSGYSLWRSDGAAAGTERLAAGGVYAPPEGSPIPWALTGGRLHFFRRPGGVLELWESDGTAPGTRRIARLPQVEDDIFAVAVHRGGVFFVSLEVEIIIGGDPGYRNWRLWRTDLASGRTRLLHGVPSAGGLELHPTAARLVFFPARGVWATDGTVQGTAPVPGPPGGTAFGVDWIGGVAGGRLLIGGRDPFRGETLWATDGAGTRLLALGVSFSPLDPDVVRLGDQSYFVAADSGHGAELWSTAGTRATTGRVTDLCPGPCPAFADPYGSSLAAAGGRVVLIAEDGAGRSAVWVADGTSAGPLKVLDLGDFGAGGWARLRSEGDLVFVHRRDGGAVELWGSDGTAAGTRRLIRLADADPFLPYGPLPAPSLAALGGRIMTLGYDLRGGFEPWSLALDGRSGRPLGDLARGGEAAAADPFDAVALGDRLLFMTGRGESGAAWSTRGSAETTVALGVLPAPRLPFEPPLTAIVGGRGYLNLGDLWVTDGTALGTERLTDLAATEPGSRVSTAIVDLGGRAVFGVTAVGSQATELWTSDGTAAGTRAAPLPPLPLRIFDLTAVGGELYFWANDGAGGWEICTADPALATMRPLTDRPDPGEPGALQVAPEFTRIGADVYFMVPDRLGGASLWRSDGTTEGTERVPPPAVGGVEQWRRTFAGLAGSVLLFTSSSSGLDLRLWAGDGSGTDWLELRDFGAGSQLGEVVRRADDLLFVVRAGGSGGLRLYRSDGTVAGTEEILDFAALGLAEVHSMISLGGRLFFGAGPEAGRTELWLSDGTPAATRRLQEIAPGLAGSEPRDFTFAGSHLYFTADDGLHGRELWSLPLDELDRPCRPSATALCLGGGRFRAELFRHDRTGGRGDGRAVPWSSASGMFWFYDYGNPEAVVKMVDGGAVNGRYWLFYGPLGDAYAALTVTDLESGEVRRWPAEAGPLPVFADLAAFPGGAAAPAGGLGLATLPGSFGATEAGNARAAAGGSTWFDDLARAAGEPVGHDRVALPVGVPAGVITVPEITACSAGPCIENPTRLCLQGGRFAVDLAWRDGSGTEHQAMAFPHGDHAGYFAFYGARDLQAALKVLDARAVDGRFWLFAAWLTHLETTLTVTDASSGTVHRYHKPAGEFESVIDLTSLQ